MLPKLRLTLIIAYLKGLGIDNLMLLRGDPPKGEGKFKAHPEGLVMQASL
jgi:5,10-methylenetetrahydrofolate reductase